MQIPTGDELRVWRRVWGLTQAEAARRCGYPARTWRRWEAGDRRVPPVMPNVLRDIERQLMDEQGGAA